MIWFFINACMVGTDDVSNDTDSLGDSESTQEIDPIENIDPADLPAGENPCRQPALAVVNHVVDGDTFYCETERGEEKVRVIGINTSEIGYQGMPDECYSQEAKQKATDLLKDNKVWLTFDEDCYDTFGRTLAYVHLGVNEQDFFERLMLRSGYAWAYPFEGTDSFSEMFSQDELAAQQSNSGGWGSCDW